jgi:hypothetical protein
MIDDLFPFQKRAIKAFNLILKDETIKSVRKNESCWEIIYDNNQVFKCSGLIVDNSLIMEKESKKKKKFF